MIERQPPAKRPSLRDEVRRNSVLMEALQKDFSLIAEAVVDTHSRVKRLEIAFDQMNDKMSEMNGRLIGLESRISSLESRVDALESKVDRLIGEMISVRVSVESIDHRLSVVESK